VLDSHLNSWGGKGLAGEEIRDRFEDEFSSIPWMLEEDRMSLGDPPFPTSRLSLDGEASSSDEIITC